MIPNLIVPVLNRYDLLQNMLDSIDFPIRHLMIIDNGEGPTEVISIPDWVKEATYTPIPNNLGVPGSWNLGIKSLPHNNRWFFASNDVEFGPGALELMAQAMPNCLTLMSRAPYWQAFVLGETVVDKIGLFDEAFYPAYFEDNDYMRRMSEADLPVYRLDVPIEHHNSSTIHSDPELLRMNDQTFPHNRALYEKKQRDNDYSVHGWSLARRRLNSWE